MLDLTTIILTFNEGVHIERCINNIKGLSKRVIVIDSYSTDDTKEVALRCGAEVIEHKWPGNQAKQFNWALSNVNITTEWILRLDADEYLLPELIEELQTIVPDIPNDVSGLVFKRRHIFLEKWVKRGIYPVKILRMFRNGAARYEQRMMDEHLLLENGKEYECKNDFCDHNLKDLSWFCKKHVDYAIREVAELYSKEYNHKCERSFGHLAENTAEKRMKKERYASMPLFFRSFGYFAFRYILKGGFLDGRAGFIFAFMQGWWYRMLIDSKIYEIRKKVGTDINKVREYLLKEYKIDIKSENSQL